MEHIYLWAAWEKIAYLPLLARGFAEMRKRASLARRRRHPPSSTRRPPAASSSQEADRLPSFPRTAAGAFAVRGEATAAPLLVGVEPADCKATSSVEQARGRLPSLPQLSPPRLPSLPKQPESPAIVSSTNVASYRGVDVSSIDLGLASMFVGC
uniref:Uncharacterized protein n=1 Tax=Oryza brachyantha TaxID=4533 RepID=J3M5C3_ORYBR